MANSVAPDPIQAGQDPVLEMFVNLANDSEVCVRISLQIGGLVVHGTLCSIATYYEELAKEIESWKADDPDTRRALAAGFKDQANDIRSDTSPTTSRPLHVHLRDVIIWGPGAQDLDARIWRGRIAAVEGFVVGRRPPGG